MKPHITVITLGVDDLERAIHFYRDGLGFRTEGIVGTEFEHGAVAFFDLQPGLKLAVWPRKSLAHDSGVPLGNSSATELSLGHNTSSRSEVDEIMAQAKNAGAVIVKPPADTFWGGYAGYFKRSRSASLGGCMEPPAIAAAVAHNMPCRPSDSLTGTS